MVDFGDLVPDAAVFYDGKRGAEMHNFYYHDYHRTISEVFQEKRGDDFILYGQSGRARYAKMARPIRRRSSGQFRRTEACADRGAQSVRLRLLDLGQRPRRIFWFAGAGGLYALDRIRLFQPFDAPSWQGTRATRGISAKRP